MQNGQLEDIQLDQIDLSDRTYLFTFEPIISNMIVSIQNIGLVNPPILGRISNVPSYRIVTGLKRVLALSHLKAQNLNAIIFEDNASNPRLELFHMGLYENVSIRQLNPVEKSSVIEKLQRIFNIDEKEIIFRYLPLLGLNPNRKVMDTYLAMSGLEDNIKIAIVEDFLSPETAIKLLDYSPEDRQGIMEIFNQLKLGKNQQRELLKLMNDISRRENIRVIEIIRRDLFQAILKEEKLSITLKLEKVKDLLRKYRFPHLHRVEEKFNQLKKALKLPPEILMSSPPFFEGDIYSMKLHFRDQDEFDKQVALLQEISEKRKLKDLGSLIS